MIIKSPLENFVRSVISKWLLKRVDLNAAAIEQSQPSIFQSMAWKNYGIQKITEDFRIVLGVPKHRTSKPKILTRRFGYFRLMRPAPIAACPDCGTIVGFSPSTLCLKCYDVIHQKTMAIKRKLMAYNPYLGERQKPIRPDELEERSPTKTGNENNFK